MRRLCRSDQRTARRCPSNTEGAQIAPAAVMLAQSRAAVAALGTGPAIRRNSMPLGRGRSRICTTGRRPSSRGPWRRSAAVQAVRNASTVVALPRSRPNSVLAGTGRGLLRRQREARCDVVVRRSLAWGGLDWSGARGGRSGRGRSGVGSRGCGGRSCPRGLLDPAIEPVMLSRLCSSVAMRATAVAVGGERAHGLGQPAALPGVERADRLDARRHQDFVDFGNSQMQAVAAGLGRARHRGRRTARRQRTGPRWQAGTGREGRISAATVPVPPWVPVWPRCARSESRC